MRKVAKHPVVERVDFQDLDLAIEFPKGSKRSYVDDQGKERFKTMKADYGEVRGTKGLDGDAVDVYVGPDRTSSKVFVVTQMKRGNWDKVDEEKCILGVGNKAAARKLYLSHYNDSRFCGAIKELSMDQFKDRLETRGTVGKKIAASSARIAELNYLRIAQGDQILIGDHGVKIALDLPKVQPRDRILGGRPDVATVPAVTDYGAAQPGQKVSGITGSTLKTDWAARVRRLKERRDPDNIEAPEFELTRAEQLGLGIPKSKVVGDPKDSKLRKAAALARLSVFTKEAAKARVDRIADRVDDVGIGMLAAPYASKAVGKALSHAPGRVGALGQGLAAAGERLSHSNALELGGLALVAPGVTHRVARGLDKRFPGQKTAGAADLAKNLVRRSAQLGATGALLAGAGAAGATLGAKKLLTTHPHEGLHAAAYQAPRLF